MPTCTQTHATEAAHAACLKLDTRETGHNRKQTCISLILQVAYFYCCRADRSMTTHTTAPTCSARHGGMFPDTSTAPMLHAPRVPADNTETTQLDTANSRAVAGTHHALQRSLARHSCGAYIIWPHRGPHGSSGGHTHAKHVLTATKEICNTYFWPMMVPGTLQPAVQQMDNEGTIAYQLATWSHRGIPVLETQLRAGCYAP